MVAGQRRQDNNVVVCAALVGAASAGDFSNYCAPAIKTGYKVKGYEGQLLNE
jgi:hypothetical protein